MSLKDRLIAINQKEKGQDKKNDSLINPLEINRTDDFYAETLNKLIGQDINILVCCPMNVPTYNAINFLCSKIPGDKRLVGIGSNLLLNPSEIIKFEPEIKESNSRPKQLIKTALSLNPYKIILQNFDGTEAADIFKLVNAGIKNIIGAVVAEDAIKALLQTELNLYINGVSVPDFIMKKMISELFDKIIVVKSDEKFEGSCYISEIYDVSLCENGEYSVSEVRETKAEDSKEESIKEENPVKPKDTPKNKLILKLKRKK